MPAAWRICLFLLCLLGTQAEGAPARPNILVLIADDLGYGELGCQGNPEVPTPHIDSLAREGVRFTSGYVTAPYCAPSRAGLLTGRNQARFGYDINPTGKHNLDPRIGLPADEVTLPDLLKEAGYATGLVGKWHLGSAPPFHPQHRGFEEFYGFLHEGHFYAGLSRPGVLSFLRTNTLPSGVSRWTLGNVTWSTHMPMSEPPYDADNPVLRGVSPASEKEFLTDAWGREAVDFIRRHREQPFFLQLAYNAPHSPMQALEAYLRKFQHIDDLHRRVFAAMVAHLDDSVGRVLDALRESGVDGQTLVFFLSDNGGPTRELTSSNAPLRGGKGQLFEGGIRVPFIVRWKGRLRAGTTYDAPVSSLDILPTALAAAGVTAPPGLALDGVNLLPYLTGQHSGLPHEALFWRYGRNCALRSGDWKLVRQAPSADFSLYNLAQDPGETNELSATQSDMARELHSKLNDWLNPLPPPLVLDARGGASNVRGPSPVNR